MNKLDLSPQVSPMLSPRLEEVDIASEIDSYLSGNETQEIRVSADSGLVGACISSKEVLNIKDAPSDPRFNSQIDHKSGFRTFQFVFSLQDYQNRTPRASNIIIHAYEINFRDNAAQMTKINIYKKIPNVVTANDKMIKQLSICFQIFS